MLISQQKLTPQFKDLINGFLDKNKNEKILSDFIPNKYVYWVGSGREALRQILLNLGKKRIGVPAYTCQVVLEAVKRAGKKAVFYDSGVIVDIEDIKKITKKIDALIVSYNFGFLPEIDKIVDLCKRNKVILIEDCAQALGARYGGKLAGSFGDYAFYSFGISKNIGFCGGLMGSDKKLRIERLKKFPELRLFKIIFKALISNLFFNKNIYLLTRKFLKKELIKEQEVLNYSLPVFAKGVVLNQFKRYNQILNKRRKNAEFCCKELKGIIDFIKPIKNTEPSWLYFTILNNKNELINKLLKEKAEIGEMKTFKCLEEGREKAGEAEEKVLTFALYRELGEIKFMVDKIKKVCR